MRPAVPVSVLIRALGALGALVTLPSLAACDDEPVPLLPAAYAASYVEVRDCRPSTDHGLTRVRVLADPGAVEAYNARDRPFPVGSVIVKEERDAADTTCSDPPTQWTVMVRLADGTSPATLDWQWQKIDAARTVLTEDEPRCIGCHTSCGNPPDGYLGTCTVP